MKTLVWCGAVVLAACGSHSTSGLDSFAVGTYIGGGSILGPDDCTYEGAPTVFMPRAAGEPDSRTPARGPRFISGAGKITIHCPKGDRTVEAFVPTAAQITGPDKIKRGAPSDAFAVHLVADGHELQGEATVDWKLTIGCDGIATFAPVLGAQDTGGKDRTRQIVATAPGKCQLTATLTTGSSLYPSFPPRAFQAEKLVTIE